MNTLGVEVERVIYREKDTLIDSYGRSETEKRDKKEGLGERELTDRQIAWQGDYTAGCHTLSHGCYCILLKK